MSQPEKSVSLKDLKAKCKALGIKDYGTKQQIADRIKAKEEEISRCQKENENNDSLKLTLEEEDDFDDEPYCENEDLDEDEVLIDVPLGQQDNSRSVSSHSTSLDESYNEIDENSKKRKRVVSCFTQFATYNNRDEATRAIKVENLWHKDRNRDTREGIKEVYKCKYSGCKMRCFLLYNADNLQV